MKATKWGVTLVGTLALVVGMLGVATPAQAWEWNGNVTCGVSNLCTFTTDTIGGVDHWIDGELSGSWPYADEYKREVHKSSRDWVSGYTTLLAAVDHLYEAYGNCVCPSGRNCGSAR